MSKFCLALAWCVCVCVQVHPSSYFRIVESWPLLYKFLKVISVENWVNLLACSVWAMRCIVFMA